MCPHGYHHSGSMATPVLGTRDVRIYIYYLFLYFYVCLDTCCSHFLTIIAGVDLHFRHESKLPVCRTRGLNQGRRGARRGC